MKNIENNEKTYIGVLTNHEDPSVNNNLVSLLNELCTGKNVDTIKKFHFIFTGGTFGRIILGTDKNITPVNKNAVSVLLNECCVTCLPGYEKGGVTILSYFITQRICSIIWAFFSPKGHHWRRPESLAQLRLCDQWNVKRLMNPGSVRRWFYNEADTDVNRNIHLCPPMLVLREGARKGETTYIFSKETISIKNNDYFYYKIKGIKEKKKEGSQETEIKIDDITEHVNKFQEPENFPIKFKDMTIALIAHDEMKGRMISFAIDHEWELRKFGTILATGTTGREVSAATSRKISDKMHRYHSGPKGGDIEIATEILFGRCHIVIFFVDPLHPHPHIDDIRTVFEACMIQRGVMMITNEMHAREFMSTVVRGKDAFTDPKALTRHKTVTS